MAKDEFKLNDRQIEAVNYVNGPLLVIAGAGSGKTRVLTNRIVHLVKDLNVSPSNILALTFTNKATKEMKQRIEKALSYNVNGMWINTFQPKLVKILPRYANYLNYDNNFSIHSEKKKKKAIKEAMDTLNISTNQITEKTVITAISKAKNNLIDEDTYAQQASDYYHGIISDIYYQYQQQLKVSNCLDFDDLLVLTVKLFKENPYVAEKYGKQFKYVLIDEYQDTNLAQYEIAKQIALYHRNIMVVGDDDQSIYSWRGADIRNILEFENDWEDAKVIYLEQNYRSTNNILKASNAIISNNINRKNKTLFSALSDGDKIKIYSASDDREEARYIASQIEKLHELGVKNKDVAVFYRTNAQSRMLEDMFLRAGVPYKIVGGTNFFDREEIRDVIAYLKLIDNPQNDICALRVINKPARKIGKVTQNAIKKIQNEKQICFIDAAKIYAEQSSCKDIIKKSLKDFFMLLESNEEKFKTLIDFVDYVIKNSHLSSYYKEKEERDSVSRLENLSEFINVVSDYVTEHSHPDNPILPKDFSNLQENEINLHNFLEWLSLRTDLDNFDEDDSSAVTFMTVHSAKGLEFDNVFVCGLEESIFPHVNSINDGGLEEERRLAFVAVTRARKRLYLTYAQVRRTFGNKTYNLPSRFVAEVPAQLVEFDGVGSAGLNISGLEKRGDRSTATYGFGSSNTKSNPNVHSSSAVYHTSIIDEIKSSKKKSQQSNINKNTSVADDAYASAATQTYAVGDKVNHKTFGIGYVTAVEADQITVQFDEFKKPKHLLKGYAPIVKLS
ncbi:MAG: UvrD-helicase domain-containing protein [Coriobacteriales bacterium]|nr:UvrD-helicase domain-containing protein [Coriobacteriales bacterium]